MSLMQFYNIRFLANLLLFNIFFFDKHDLHVSEFSDQLLTTVYCAMAAVHRVRGGHWWRGTPVWHGWRGCGQNRYPCLARVARLWAAATHRVLLLRPRASSLTSASFVEKHPQIIFKF